MRRNHPAPAPALVEEPQSSDEELEIDSNQTFENQQDLLAAKFAISLESEHKLSQQATDIVVDSTKFIFEQSFSEY